MAKDRTRSYFNKVAASSLQVGVTPTPPGTDASPGLFLVGSPAAGAAATATATAGTISTSQPYIRVKPTGNITGVILAAGKVDGQQVEIVNESAFSIAFNSTDATANVLGASSVSIPAKSSLSLTWDTAAGTSGLWVAGFAPAAALSGNQAISGNMVITSASANALAVGPNGTTNPTFNVDDSTASDATGVNIKGAAAGGGVAVSVLSSGSNEALKIDAKGTGNITIGGTSTGQISIGRGSVGTPILSSSTASLGTTQNSTPTAAQLLGGFVTQTSATGAGTVTTPTGTQLSAAVANIATGDSFQTMFANLGGGFNLTITAGASGMTVVGNAVVPSGKNAILDFVCTGSNTWNCYVNVSA